MIKEKFIQELKERASIVEVIGQHVTLKRKGNNHVGCCPFHNEKTPSFTVSETKGQWTCFGCNKSGDVFAFFKEQGLEFQDQVKAVAEAANIPVEYEANNLTPAQQEKLKEKKDKAETFFIQNQRYWEHCQEKTAFPVLQHPQDKGSPHTLTALVHNREYSLETIHEFGLAVAPVQFLATDGKKAGFDLQTLVDGGLLLEKENGHTDRFNGRLLFPIYIGSHTPQRRGKIAGFGGRVAPGDPYTDKKAKYINSPETLIYAKSKILFGLHQAKPYIQQAKTGGCVILVEGYTDVITPFDAGMKNVVAKCGTALTPEQAALLKKYAKTVIIIPDTDPKYDEEGNITEWPGLDAVRRKGGDIDVCLDAGLHVEICLLPQIPHDPANPEAKRKNDPDSFMRAQGLKGFQFYLDENTEDAIEWRVLDILQVGNGQDVKELAAETAVSMLAKIKSPYTRNSYMKTICSAKFLKAKETDIAGMVLNKQLEGQARKNGRSYDLTPLQEDSLYRYGFYIGRPYDGKTDVFMGVDPNTNAPVRFSNFRIEPEYHVFSETQPERKIRVQNEDGITRIVDLHTDTYEDYKAFQKAMGALGNFRFTQQCKAGNFHGIVTYLYQNMPSVLRIEKIGQHSTGEMFVWGNGVTLPDGKFYQKQENGLIQVGSETYRIPGRTDQDEQKKKLDNSLTTDSFLETFIHVGGDCPSWADTVKMIYEVHGHNGMVGIAYYLLCLYRSEIYPNYTQEFPILNGTGPPRKGKTQLWWLLSSFFGIPENPVNLSNVTQFGITQLIETRRDAMLGFDEYKNSLDRWKIEFIKDISDGSGRLKGAGKDTRSLSKSQVLSGVYLFGQDLPTADIAALTRMVTCWFADFEKDQTNINDFEALKKLRQTGVFSQHTSAMQAHRQAVAKDILQAWYHCKGELKTHFSKDVDERIMNTHSWLLAIVFVLQDHVQFPEIEPGKMFFETLFGIMVTFAKRQLKYISKEDENASFWSILQNQAMVEKTIRHKEHFWVSIEEVEKFYQTETSKDTREMKWDKPHKLIYINVELLYEAYKKGFKGDMDGKKPLPKESLIGYLEMDKDFLGTKKAKKLGGVARSVMVFNIGTVEGEEISGGLSERSFDLPTNNEARLRFAANGEPQEAEGQFERNEDLPKEELPF